MVPGKHLMFGHKWLPKCSRTQLLTWIRRGLAPTHTMAPAALPPESTLNWQRQYSTHTARHWKHLTKATHKHDNGFSVMSYNILAQNYIESQPSLYAHHDPKCLQWSHRFDALKREIDGIDPDVLCLQEVQQNHLDDIRAHFTGLGYDTSMYKKRTGLQVDGCAIFFKRQLFDLVECHFVDYFQPDVKVYWPMGCWHVCALIEISLVWRLKCPKSDFFFFCRC